MRASNDYNFRAVHILYIPLLIFSLFSTAFNFKTYTLYFVTFISNIFIFHAIHILYISLHIFSLFSTSMQYIYFIFPYIYFPNYHFVMDRRKVSVEKNTFRYVARRAYRRISMIPIERVIVNPAVYQRIRSSQFLDVQGNGQKYNCAISASFR